MSVWVRVWLWQCILSWCLGVNVKAVILCVFMNVLKCVYAVLTTGSVKKIQNGLWQWLFGKMGKIGVLWSVIWNLVSIWEILRSFFRNNPTMFKLLKSVIMFLIHSRSTEYSIPFQGFRWGLGFIERKKRKTCTNNGERCERRSLKNSQFTSLSVPREC